MMRKLLFRLQLWFWDLKIFLTSHDFKSRLKKSSSLLGRFSFTVLCATLLSLWIQSHQHKLKKQWKLVTYRLASVFHGPTVRRMPLRNPHQEKYLVKVKGFFAKVRRNKRFRMLRTTVPSELLGNRRSLATRNTQYWIRARKADAPVIAVSRKLKSYLDKHEIMYIDPARLSARSWEKISLPLSKKAVTKILLIPEITKEKAYRFN